jgi:hypothetical protein
MVEKFSVSPRHVRLLRAETDRWATEMMNVPSGSTVTILRFQKLSFILLLLYSKDRPFMMIEFVLIVQ